MKKTITLLILLCAAVLPLAAQSPSTVTTTTTATITKTRETWRIQAEVTPADVSLEILRRDRTTVDGTDIGTEPAPTIRRTLSASAADAVTLADGTQLTFAQLFEAFSRFTALWEAEDATPPPPAEEPVPEEP